MTLAQYEMMGAVQLARESNNPQALALPLYNLAQLHEDVGELLQAIHIYKEAVKNMEQNPPDVHNRSSVLENMKLHLATCEYKNGDTGGLERAKKALLKIAEEPNKYNHDVWVSGGYMRIAEILKKDDAKTAKYYLAKAKEIIDANPELKLRKKQLEKTPSPQ